MIMFFFFFFFLFDYVLTGKLGWKIQLGSES